MTAVSRERPAASASYTVERLRDREVIRALLEPERPYAAYALAQLDPALFPANDWLLSTGARGDQALLVHSRSGLGNALFAIGDPAALNAALRLHPGARFTFGSLRLEHKRVAEKHFFLARPQTMLRMSVTRESFQPAEGTGAVRLTTGDVGMVNRLYSIEGGPTSYRGNHLEEGMYYGVFVGGDLVSVAGTHVVSHAERIAVVGNVFTHPRHRARGLATIATSATTRTLLEFCDLVALTVEERNDPAVKIYRKLGYETQCKLHETPLIRKEPLGAVSFVRRIIAGWRGRRVGKEVTGK